MMSNVQSSPLSLATHHNTQVRWVGAGLCALSAAGFASLTIFGKIALTEHLSIPTILFVRFGGAALLLAAYLGIVQHARLLLGFRLTTILFTLGAVGYFGQSYLYFGALQRNPAALNALLLYVYPIFVVLFGWAINHKPPTWRQWGALALACAGVTLTIGVNRADLMANRTSINPAGLLMIISSSAWYAWYILISDRFVHQAGALVSTTWISTGAAVSFGIAGLLTGMLDLRLTPVGRWLLPSMVLFSTILPLSTFFACMRRVGPTTASLLSTLEPVFTVILAVTFLQEKLSTTQILGGALVLASVVLLANPQRLPPKSEDTLTTASN
jgi:drug/metabolite transporter (DMT)-like permease